MKFDKSKIKKILIIKQKAIGDVLLSTPMIENLRYHFPDSEIIFLTQKYCVEVLTHNPYLTRVLAYDLGIDSGYCLVKNIRMQNYDLVIDLFGNPRTAIITLLSRAKYKAGYRFGWRTIAYNIKVKPRGGEVHNIEFNLDSLRALGLEIVTAQPKIYINKIQEEFASQFFKENKLEGKQVIGINPCGTWETKVWQKEKFIELMKKFGNETQFLLFWGYTEENELCQSIKDAIGDNVKLIPQVDLKYMTALLRKCKAFLTNDTGPMHIAWTSGVPTAAIFGPTNSHLQGPLSSNSAIIRNESLTCLGCNLTNISECPYEHKCMRELSVGYVYEQLKKLLL